LALGTLSTLKLTSAPDLPHWDAGEALSPLAVVNEHTAIAVRGRLSNLTQRMQHIASRREPSMIALVDTLMQGAIQVGASDVHIHPRENGTQIALRLHGMLEELLTLPQPLHPMLINRLKVMARLGLSRLNRPQDGNLQLHAPEGTIDVRLSLLPTNHGESAALRLARSGVKLPQLAELGMPPTMLERYQETLALPQGVIFLTGATGSGKTTTLYSSLGFIKQTRGDMIRVATIEDPIEFDVPMFSQTSVNAEQGLTFAQGLRSVLRQDPNVIMVGEIRDAETARTAIQAGLSGHLILTTVHANSAAGVFNRLIEMGVEPFVLASAAVASISQRLIRTLCPKCRETALLSPQEALRLDVLKVARGPFFSAPGCDHCGGQGYLGRAALFEMLTVTPAIRECINGKVPTSKIHDTAMSEGTVPLLQMGLEHARTGATTLREVFRVAG
jgi:general secretion pathway protein E